MSELGALSSDEKSLLPDKDYIGTIEGEMVLEHGLTIGVALHVYGKWTPYSLQTRDDPGDPGGFVIDRVMYGEVDVSAELPDMAMEIITLRMNGAVRGQ